MTIPALEARRVGVSLATQHRSPRVTLALTFQCKIELGLRSAYCGVSSGCLVRS